MLPRLFLGVFLALAGCGAFDTEGVRSISVETLRTDLDAKKYPILVDVRTGGEFRAGHVPGAVNLPLDELPARIDELKGYKGKEIAVICQSGSRSTSAARILAEQGYRVANVSGGTGAWIRSDFPTE